MDVSGNGITATPLTIEAADPTIHGADPVIIGADPTIHGSDPTIGISNPTWVSPIGTITDLMQYLLVTPEVLVEKADSVLGKIKVMQSCFEELERKITGTSNYWQGEAAEMHREKYQNKKESIDEIFRRLNEDVEDLRQMAAVYTATENEVNNIVADLPGDVIV